MEPEPVELVLKSGGEAPAELRSWPPERSFQYIRCRPRFTQSELAQKAGLTQSQVSRVESGADCLLSTWTKVYAAMGFELRLLPTSGLGVDELEKRAEAGRPYGHWLRQRARPRRRRPYPLKTMAASVVEAAMAWGRSRRLRRSLSS